MHVHLHVPIPCIIHREPWLVALPPCLATLVETCADRVHTKS